MELSGWVGGSAKAGHAHFQRLDFQISTICPPPARHLGFPISIFISTKFILFFPFNSNLAIPALCDTVKSSSGSVATSLTKF